MSDPYTPTPKSSFLDFAKNNWKVLTAATTAVLGAIAIGVAYRNSKKKVRIAFQSDAIFIMSFVTHI